MKCAPKIFGWNPLKNASCQKCPKECEEGGCDNIFTAKILNFTNIASNQKEVQRVINDRRYFNPKYMKLVCRCPEKETFNTITKKCEKCPKGCSKCLILQRVIKNKFFFFFFFFSKF